MEELKLGRYRHFKGGEYEVLAVGEDSETGEKLVVYKQLYDAGNKPKGHIWIRPLEMFLGDKILDGRKVKRFVYIGDKD
ncbi:MAG: DUF1653 domain-containing protein [Candidatus Nanoarchaeia archaeon]